MADDEQDPTQTEGDPEDAGEPPEPVMEGDKQLSLNLGTVLPRTAAKKPTEATVKLSAQQVPIDGLLAADTEYDFLVRGKVQRYIVQPDRNADGDSEGAAVHMPVRTLRVTRADTSGAIVELFERLAASDSAAAKSVLDALPGVLRSTMREAA